MFDFYKFVVCPLRVHIRCELQIQIENMHARAQTSVKRLDSSRSKTATLPFSTSLTCVGVGEFRALYIKLGDALFKDVPDEFTTGVAKTVRGARPLTEAGFEKTDAFDGIHIYRKQK